MNQLQDDLQIRELMRRLKRVDERHAPGFDDLLQRRERALDRRTTIPPRLVLACSLAVTLFITFWFVRSRQEHSVLELPIRVAEDSLNAQPMNRYPSGQVADLDFDQLRRAIETHFNRAEATSGAGIPVWSSRTESLLAVNLNIPLDQE